TFGLNGSPWNLQSNNLTADLVARGVPVQGKVTELYDVGGGFGGPIRRDRLWVYATDRWGNNKAIVPGTFFNATPQPPSALIPIYTPDVSRPAERPNPNHNDDLRVTWQVTKEHKIATFVEIQSSCACHLNASSSRAIEASVDQKSPYGSKNLVQGTWTYVKG